MGVNTSVSTSVITLEMVFRYKTSVVVSLPGPNTRV